MSTATPVSMKVMFFFCFDNWLGIGTLAGSGSNIIQPSLKVRDYCGDNSWNIVTLNSLVGEEKSMEI